LPADPAVTRGAVQSRATVGELLAGNGIDYPHVAGSNITLGRTQRAQGQAPVALPLFGDEPADAEASDAKEG
jgi:hypothetical protein